MRSFFTKSIVFSEQYHGWHSLSFSELPSFALNIIKPLTRLKVKQKAGFTAIEKKSAPVYNLYALLLKSVHNAFKTGRRRDKFMKIFTVKLQFIGLLLLSGCAGLYVGGQADSASKSGALETSIPCKKVEVQTLAKSTASWDGNLLPKFPSGQPEITILRITIPPKTSLPVHKHPVINAGVMLKGELTVLTEDGRRLHLKAGEPIVEVVDNWHYGRNEGSVPAEILVFYAGTEALPITVYKEQ